MPGGERPSLVECSFCQLLPLLAPQRLITCDITGVDVLRMTMNACGWVAFVEGGSLQEADKLHCDGPEPLSLPNLP